MRYIYNSSNFLTKLLISASFSAGVACFGIRKSTEREFFDCFTREVFLKCSFMKPSTFSKYPLVYIFSLFRSKNNSSCSPEITIFFFFFGERINFISIC